MHGVPALALALAAAATLCNAAVLERRIVSPSSSSDSAPFDYLMFTMIYPIAQCMADDDTVPDSCEVPKNAEPWTIHGLWPNYNDGSYPQFCSREKFDVSKVAELKERMDREWPNLFPHASESSLWKHEFEKHGTCATSDSLIDTQYKYFNMTLFLLENVNIRERLEQVGVSPRSAPYGREELLEKITKATGGKTPQLWCLKDKKTGGYLLSDIRVCVDSKLEQIDCPKHESVRPRTQLLGDEGDHQPLPVAQKCSAEVFYVNSEGIDEKYMTAEGIKEMAKNEEQHKATEDNTFTEHLEQAKAELGMNKKSSNGKEKLDWDIIAKNGATVPSAGLIVKAVDPPLQGLDEAFQADQHVVTPLRDVEDEKEQDAHELWLKQVRAEQKKKTSEEKEEKMKKEIDDKLVEKLEKELLEEQKEGEEAGKHAANLHKMFKAFEEHEEKRVGDKGDSSEEVALEKEMIKGLEEVQAELKKVQSLDSKNKDGKPLTEEQRAEREKKIEEVLKKAEKKEQEIVKEKTALVDRLSTELAAEKEREMKKDMEDRMDEAIKAVQSDKSSSSSEESEEEMEKEDKELAEGLHLVGGVRPLLGVNGHGQQQQQPHTQEEESLLSPLSKAMLLGYILLAIAFVLYARFRPAQGGRTVAATPSSTLPIYVTEKPLKPFSSKRPLLHDM